MRIAFVLIEVKLVHHFHPFIYLLGGILVLAGILMFEKKQRQVIAMGPVNHSLNKIRSTMFETNTSTKLFSTCLLYCIIIIEALDLILAMDSVPSLLSVTTEKFLLYTCIVFAALGLRLLCFSFAGVLELFYHLHYSLSFVTVFVGIKIVVDTIFHIPTFVSLVLIVSTLSFSVIISQLYKRNPVGIDYKNNK